MLVDINLLPQKERDRPAFLLAAISIIVLGLIIWLVLFLLAGAEESERADLNAQAAEISAQQAALREQLDATTGLNEEQQLQATVTWAESYEFDTVPLMEELVLLLPERGFFDTFSYIEPNAATLTVQFDEVRDASFYLAHLKESPLIASVTLDTIVTEELETLAEEENTVVQRETPIPRYLATYSIAFIDNRIPAEGMAEEGELPVEETPVEETPAEDTDVDVNVDVDTDTAPEDDETGGVDQ